MTKRTAKAAPPKLPAYLYARVERDRDGEEDIWAYRTEVEAIADDGPTLIGSYQLVNKRVMVKRPMAQRATDVTAR